MTCSERPARSSRCPSRTDGASRRHACSGWWSTAFATPPHSASERPLLLSRADRLRKSAWRLSRHDVERRDLPYAKAKLFVEPDRSRVGAEDVEEHTFRANLDARDQGADELGRKPLTAMVRPGADGADLRPTVQAEPLAGHRDERPVAADPQVIAELDGPR